MGAKRGGNRLAHRRRITKTHVGNLASAADVGRSRAPGRRRPGPLYFRRATHPRERTLGNAWSVCHTLGRSWPRLLLHRADLVEHVAWVLSHAAVRHSGHVVDGPPGLAPPGIGQLTRRRRVSRLN